MPRSFRNPGLLAFLSILAMLLVVVAVLACLVRPDALAGLTLIPAWFFSLAAFALAWMLWRVRAGRRALALAAAALLFSVGWVEETWSLPRGLALSLASDERPSSGIRIVSLNCDGNERCVEDLLAVRPDLVLLQEVPGPNGLRRMGRELFGETAHVVTNGSTAILS